MALGTLLPEISISPAPLQELPVEPKSPFSVFAPTVQDEMANYRPIHLTPPPTSATFKALSPLRPAEARVSEGAGMLRERFEALLQASRQRQAALPAKKEGGLLREIAVKTHKNKQLERRALFLSKVLAPPSPTATCTPKTPPESPAIFHYSLPSPGLASPLSLFESLDNEVDTIAKEHWVEQVEFKLPAKSTVRKAAAPAAPSLVSRSSKAVRPLPSLAQISAHMQSRSSSQVTEHKASRLPAFLSTPRRLPTPPTDRPRLVTGVGRLNMPVRAQPEVPTIKVEAPMLPPVTPTSPLTPKLQVTTLLVPPSAVRPAVQLTASNLQSLASREQRAKNMISTIRKRRSMPSAECLFSGLPDESTMPRSSTHAKRKSAPGDLSQSRHNIWGAAPVLGGF